MSENRVQRLTIEQLTPGMVIVQVTRQNGPVRIRKSGLVTSHSMVQGLAEMGVQEVEIDPAQTVEVETPVVGRTQTQQLLRGDHDTRGAQDAQVSEQFNRSLFLPTIQGLPSPWRHTLIQAGQFVAIAILGIGLGFAGGSASGWWPALFSSSTLVQNTTNPSSQTPSNPVDDATTSSVSANIKNEGSNREAQPDESAQGLDPQESASAVQTEEPVAASTEAPAVARQHSDEDSQPEPAPAASQDDYAGKVLNEPDQSSQAKVSQALLDKFNQAIDDLDETPKAERGPEVPVNVSDDIMRVDELPARLLTRLPAMKFSAHMYASNPADRWVRVNGKQRGEGDWINDEVQVVKIEGQRVILGFQGEQFSMAALTDW
ncbi:general secretion pathway protein GspB [Salinimonas marina]|uniref:General secretion pathway protein GspB n=1 Tax=Salinimonas marina TaxID=2785918 RepID=A0A7S9HF22_9ALTE|nr:general secretion pathway protein GspB [Salinimonas marina]QPG07231.1 general secretion pathway protein GspB [Salinimonas marina]